MKDLTNKYIKFLGIEPSTRKDKKYMAIFQIGTTGTELKEVVVKKIHFGDKKYSDFTIHKDEERRKLYVNRHRNDNLENPLSPGSLSMYILWSKPSIEQGVNYYKSKFNF